MLDLETALSRLLTTLRASKRNYQSVFECSLVLADSKNQQLAKKAQEIVATAIARKWLPYSNKRDPIREYEYRGIRLQWYRQYLNKLSK